MLNIIIFGPPSSGKGTQAKILAQKFSLKHLSTGELFRNLDHSSDLFLEVSKYTSKGNLVPDDIVVDLIEREIHKYKPLYKGFVFDGFPRDINQSKLLDIFIRSLGDNVDFVFCIDLPENIILKRATKRRDLEGREDDKDINIIKHRIEVYNETYKDLLEYYKSQEKLFLIDGDQSPEKVFEDICQILK